MSGAKPKARTGVPGLDDILLGGWPPAGSFSWKAARAPARPPWRCSFLLEGAKVGERGLYITLSETEHELRAGAQSHGWDLDDKIEIFEIVPPESLLDSEPAAEPALFLRPRARRDDQAHLRCRRAQQGPARRLDSPVGDPPAGAELAALPAPDPGAEALFRPSRRRPCCCSTTSRPTRSTRPCTASPPASSGWRRWRPTTAPSGDALRVIKYRGQGFRGGYHDFVIRRGGVHVFPRLVAAEHRRDFKRATHRQRHCRPGQPCWAAASSAAPAPC